MNQEMTTVYIYNPKPSRNYIGNHLHTWDDGSGMLATYHFPVKRFMIRIIPLYIYIIIYIYIIYIVIYIIIYIIIYIVYICKHLHCPLLIPAGKTPSSTKTCFTLGSRLDMTVISPLLMTNSGYRPCYI